MGKNRKGLLILVFFVAMCVVQGCTATKKIKEDILGGEDHLKRKIAFFTGTNQSGRGGEKLGPMISASLKDYVSQHCQNVVTIDSQKVQDSLERIPLLAAGKRDNMALAQVGRVVGLNAVLESTLIDIWFTWEKRGIWGFRDEVPLMKVTLGVKSYDIETTATVVNEVFLEEVALTDETYREGDELTQYSEALIKTALKQVVSKVAEQVCDRLFEAAWKGFIVGREGDAYVISAGQDVGLKEGDRMEVLGMADPMEGLEGAVFLVPGPKIGELQVTKVFPDKVWASVTFGEADFEKSCSVQLKQE